jgi:hypothetical protein
MGEMPAAQQLRARGPMGLVIAMIGLVLVLIGTLAVPWGRAFFIAKVTYFDLATAARHESRVPTSDEFAVTYFSGLGLVLLVVVAVLAILSVLPARVGQERTVLRLLTALSVLFALGSLIAATQQISEVVKLDAGPWVAGVGYALVMVGAMIGPARAG